MDGQCLYPCATQRAELKKGSPDFVVLQQLLAETLVILQLTGLIPTAPKIIKVGLSELSPKICQIFCLECMALYFLETFNKIRPGTFFAFHGPEM